ncbi:hypothetical protein PC129_g12795 [Phytophthora cactorum]|uniref:Uncharacterized protein n=1 Tax=Phytophthora cactorum TaxID=29920 RepID=A0A8T1HWV7_9STRA|nr:hypothetical protein PC129_g12795 [Phytophthora cactorum]KAG4233070.1 hypothetical protein PC116_g18718 [Phytophthora cactorum]
MGATKTWKAPAAERSCTVGTRCTTLPTVNLAFASSCDRYMWNYTTATTCRWHATPRFLARKTDTYG